MSELDWLDLPVPPLINITSPEGIQGKISDWTVVEDMSVEAIPAEYFGGYCNVCGRPISYDKGYWHKECQSWPFRVTKADILARRRSEFDRKSKMIRKVLIQRDGERCKFCGTTDKLTIDHIVSIYQGGSDDLDNLQLLCSSCNSRKGNR
jgi:hypothetical protein